MLDRVGDVHGYATKTVRSGMFVSTRDHMSVGYRVPREWAGLSGAHRAAGSLAAFTGGSRGGFLAGYRAFDCGIRGCAVCGGGDQG